MRTRNLGVRPGLRVVRCALAAATIGFAAAAGCGGGGGDDAAPAITLNSVSTDPAPLTYVGGNATVSVNVTDPAGVTPSSVMVDVKDSAGTSLIGGPQAMNPIVTPAGTFTYSFPVPNNIAGSANKVYSVSVTAKDTIGNSPTQPVVVGSVTVPFPPPPPPAP